MAVNEDKIKRRFAGQISSIRDWIPVVCFCFGRQSSPFRKAPLLRRNPYPCIQHFLTEGNPIIYPSYTF